MKKLLTLVALLATFSSFGQNVLKWQKYTTHASTSRWSSTYQQYIDNLDYHEQDVVWDIVLDSEDGTGFITSGSITYRVKSTEIKEQDGVEMVVMQAFNERIDLPVMVIAGVIDGRFKMGVFVEAHKTVYYFYE
jgi:hypothetical protein